MRKIGFFVVVAALLCTMPVFATRVNIPYGEITYMMDTARNLTADSTFYLQGVYDGISHSLEGGCLKDIHEWLTTVQFPQNASEENKTDYQDGFIDVIANHTRPTMGEWTDIYPVFLSALEGDTWEDAVTAALYGQARFFLNLEPMNVINVTSTNK